METMYATNRYRLLSAGFNIFSYIVVLLASVFPRNSSLLAIAGTLSWRVFTPLCQAVCDRIHITKILPEN
jgi:hypothetical protein